MFNGSQADVTLAGLTYNSEYWVEVERNGVTSRTLTFHTPACTSQLDDFRRCRHQPSESTVPAFADGIFKHAFTLHQSLVIVIISIIIIVSDCLCFYDIALWKSFKVGAMNKFRSSYNKCVKLFFGYRRADRVTTMLRELALLTFDTTRILFNSKQRYIRCRHNVPNGLVACVNACVH